MNRLMKMDQLNTSPGPVYRLAAMSVVVLVCLGFTSSSMAADSPDVKQVDPPAARVPGEVLVRFTADSSPTDRGSALDAAGAEAAEAISYIPRARRVALEPGQSIDDALEALRGRDDVAWAQPNIIGRISNTPNDPQLGQLWAFNNTGQFVDGDVGSPGADISALSAWDQSTGGSTKVAVVDTGIDPTNPDISPNLDTALSRNFAYPIVGPTDPGEVSIDSSDWADENGHGTHVAGTIAAAGNNGIGVAGVNWTADLIAVRACDFDGYCDSASVASALAYAGDTGARTANVSLGFTGTSDESSAMRSAINAHPDTLYVVAAGNETADNDTTATWPCNLDLANVVCVAATNQNDDLADFSNWGKTTVDLGAPGTNILSTVPNIVEKMNPDLPDGLTGWGQSPAASWNINVTPGGHNAITYAGGGASATVTSPAIDFTGGRSCSAVYYLKATLHAGQTITPEVSIDNGATWKNPGPYEPIDADADLDPTEFTDLSVWLGSGDSHSQVKLRFVVHTSGGPAPSVQVALPTITCIDAQPEGGSYEYYSGTSMASPETTGAAALVFSRHPEFSVADARTALLGTVDPIQALADKTVTGGRLDLNAAVSYTRPVTPPNRFSVTSVKRLRNGRAVLRVKVPAAGNLRIYGTGKVGAASKSVGRAGTFTLRVRARGKAARQLNRNRRARVNVKLGYRPTGGSLAQRHRVITLVRGR